MLERRMEEQNFLRFQTGILASTVKNIVGGEDGKPVDPLTYVPGWLKQREEELDRGMTDAQRIASMANFFGNGPKGRPN